MNLLEPWNCVFFVGFVVYVRIRHVFIRHTRNEKRVISHMGSMEKILLAAMFPAVMLLPLVYLFTPLLAFADYRLPAIVPGIGTAMMISSIWLFWRSHVDLDRNWSVSLEIREGHELVSHGVYRRIRHPMYASIWLWAFAQGMMLQNWLAGWAVVPAFTAMYCLRASREEQMMCENFGDEYREYARRTGRLIPRFGVARSAATGDAE